MSDSSFSHFPSLRSRARPLAGCCHHLHVAVTQACLSSISPCTSVDVTTFPQHLPSSLASLRVAQPFSGQSDSLVLANLHAPHRLCVGPVWAFSRVVCAMRCKSALFLPSLWSSPPCPQPRSCPAVQTILRVVSRAAPMASGCSSQVLNPSVPFPFYKVREQLVFKDFCIHTLAVPPRLSNIKLLKLSCIPFHYILRDVLEASIGPWLGFVCLLGPAQ